MKYTKNQLIGILERYLTLIKRGGAEYPAVVLDDIQKSIIHVLKEENKNAS